MPTHGISRTRAAFGAGVVPVVRAESSPSLHFEDRVGGIWRKIFENKLIEPVGNMADEALFCMAENIVPWAVVPPEASFPELSIGNEICEHSRAEGDVVESK